MGGWETRAAEVNDATTPPRGESLGLPGASQGDPKTKPSEQDAAWRKARSSCHHLGPDSSHTWSQGYSWTFHLHEPINPPHLLKTLVNMFNRDNFLFLIEKGSSWCHLRGHNSGIAVELKHALSCFLTEAVTAWGAGSLYEKSDNKASSTHYCSQCWGPAVLASPRSLFEMQDHSLASELPNRSFNKLCMKVWEAVRILPLRLTAWVTITKSPDFSDFSCGQWRSQ